MKIEDNPILQQISQYLCETLQMELLNQGHTASEALFNSIHSVVDNTLFGVSIDVKALHYAEYVNKGRAAGLKGVPLDVLVEWVRQKKLNMDGKREQSVAFAIQQKIKTKGIKPSRFIDKSIAKFEKSKTLERNVGRFMTEWIDDVVKTFSDQLNEK